MSSRNRRRSDSALVLAAAGLWLGAFAAPAAAQSPGPADAIDFLQKLKKEPGLSVYKIDSAPPAILPNGTAHFAIYGKL